MTLLVLLVSIAVLEYVLRRPDPVPGQDSKTSKNREAVIPEAAVKYDASPNLGPSLLQLGRAVEQFGRGSVPQTDRTQPAPKETKAQ